MPPDESKPNKSNKPQRILSIDGGGVRGVIPAMFLVELEEMLGGPAAQYFDLIAGTSTGGFMALLLTVPGPDGAKPRYSARDILKFYEEHAKDVFPLIDGRHGMTDPLFPSPEKVFHQYFGDAELKNAVTDVLVTAYDMDSRNFCTFSRRDARDDRLRHWSRNCYMRDLARATTCYPMVFPAAEFRSVDGKKLYHMLDGGLGAVNPVATAMSHCMINTGLQQADLFLVMSLGTGDFRRAMPFAEVCNWGAAQWTKDLYLVSVMFDGMASAANNAMELALRLQPFYRFQVPLPQDIPFHDSRPATIEALKSLATKVINGRTELSYDPKGDNTRELLQDLADQLKTHEFSEKAVIKRITALTAAIRGA